MEQSTVLPIAQTAEIRPRSELLIVTLVVLVAILGPFSSDSYLPSLPAMTQALGSSAHMLKLTITIYLLGFALSQLAYGPLSDRFGRRHLILTGLTIGTIGSVLCILRLQSVGYCWLDLFKALEWVQAMRYFAQ